ncbi:MAG: hypothetical protein N3G74_00865, partial [Candidatus Micrarchaeota archaeon]|nr:hypothetical protein [Candidatus Micrarchaeota archaeon]
MCIRDSYRSHAFLFQPFFELRNGWKVGLGLVYRLEENEMKMINYLIQRKGKSVGIRIDGKKTDRINGYVEFDYYTSKEKEGRDLINSWDHLRVSASGNAKLNENLYINGDVGYTNYSGTDTYSWYATLRCIRRF